MSVTFSGFTKSGTDRKIVVKIPSMRFNEDRLVGSTLDPCFQMNATTLIGVWHSQERLE